MSDGAPKRLIPKHELRKIKIRVAQLRKKGHEVFTDEEVEKEGWTLNPTDRGFVVSHTPQKEEWDCGLACARMALGVLSDAMPSPRLLAQRVDGDSVWTIDLAYVLKEYGVDVRYLTEVLELNESEYSGNAFYAPSLKRDAWRVNRLLRAAPAEGVIVEQRTLSAAELWNLMSDEETLVIALVDARILNMRAVPSSDGGKSSARPGSGSKKKGKGEAKASRSEDPPETFQGHYVLLLGVDTERGGYLLNDPARSDERTFVKADVLEAARHAKGTDEDLLLINIYQETPPKPPPPGRESRIHAVMKPKSRASKEEAEEVEAAAADSGTASDASSVALR